MKILQKSRDNFRILVDSSPYSFLLTDKYLNIKTISKATSTLLSTEIREIVNKNIRLFLAYDTYFQDKFHDNSHFVLSANIIKDKTPVECTIFCPKEGKEEYFWFIRDIQKDVDFQIFFQKLMDSLPLAFVKLDYKGNFIFFNKKFREIFPFKEYRNINITIFFHWHNFYKILENVKKNVFDFYEMEFDSPNGNKYLSFYFFDSPLNESFIYCIIYDLTSIEELYMNMENLLEEQSKFSKEKDILFARMSHEIRTPLNTIIGLTDYLYDCLKKETNFEKYEELLSDLFSSSQHLLMIINEILDFNKISSGIVELKEELFNFYDIIKESILPFEKLVNKKGLSYRVTYDEAFNSLVLKGDKTKIKQILFNLISNSIKFTEKGGITLKINLKEEESINETKIYLINIDISDTGIGIPRDEIEGLFKPFSQLSQGKNKGGTGLGLYISREIARIMGGDITFQSIEGGGTTFTVRFRLKGVKKDDSKGINMISITENKSDNLQLFKGGHNALVVDDVEINRKVLRLMIEKMGWKVSEASSGFECLNVIERGGIFSVIFMDISMPDMDGVETLKKIREKDINTPVIACTAFALHGDRERFIKEGFDGYIPKPITKENLVREINKVMESLSLKDPTYPEENNQLEKIRPLPYEPIDYNELVKTCDGMEELARELLGDLVNQGVIWLKEAEELVAKRDYDGIRRICHLIKGTASTIYANHLMDTAIKLGEIAKYKRDEELSESFNEFSHSLKNTINWCREKLQKN